MLTMFSLNVQAETITFQRSYQLVFRPRARRSRSAGPQTSRRHCAKANRINRVETSFAYTTCRCWLLQVSFGGESSPLMHFVFLLSQKSILEYIVFLPIFLNVACPQLLKEVQLYLLRFLFPKIVSWKSSLPEVAWSDHFAVWRFPFICLPNRRLCQMPLPDHFVCPHLCVCVFCFYSLQSLHRGQGSFCQL